MRLNKYLADQDIASRREADALIKAGLVFVNGQRAELGQDVNPATDKITVKTTQSKTLVYLAYHKAKGVDSVEGLKNIPDLPKQAVLVGRLEKDTSGLMILTNDGRLTKKLIGPTNKTEKEYRLTVNKKITPWFLRHLTAKLIGEDKNIKPPKIVQISDETIDITLVDSRKQSLTKFVSDLGANIKTLHRLRIGPVHLSGLKSGHVRDLKETEIKEILK